jgi:uncharacterized membrane protein/mono/diheme cytochrome c family protein
MSWNVLIRFCAVVAWLTRPEAVLGDGPGADGRDLAAEVRSVFSAKCAGCHGPSLAKPKGRFGYVLDLARVAGNREMVVPSAPDESELWELVRRNEMPPDDSPSGPLTQEQKEVIRAWIKAGAPPAVAGATRATSDPELQQGTAAASPQSPAVRALRWLGRFHILVVHFPIALLLAAAAGEVWFARGGNRTPAPAVRFCVLLGTAGAVAAAALGWLHAWAGNGAGAPAVLGLHRWLGTATAVWAVGTVLLSEWDEWRGTRSPWFRLSLLVGALLVGAAAHFGGVLVHGDDFLTFR